MAQDAIFTTQELIDFFTPTSQSDFAPYVPIPTQLTTKALNKLYNFTYYKGTLQALLDALETNLKQGKTIEQIATNFIDTAFKNFENQNKINPNDPQSVQQEKNIIVSMNSWLRDTVDVPQMSVFLDQLNQLKNSQQLEHILKFANLNTNSQIVLKRSMFIDFFATAEKKVQLLQKEIKELNIELNQVFKKFQSSLKLSSHIELLALLNSGNIQQFHKAFNIYKSNLESRISWCTKCVKNLIDSVQNNQDLYKQIVEGSFSALCLASSMLDAKVENTIKKMKEVLSSDLILLIFFAIALVNFNFSVTILNSTQGFLSFAIAFEMFFTNFKSFISSMKTDPMFSTAYSVLKALDMASLSINYTWDIGTKLYGATSTYLEQLTRLSTELAANNYDVTKVDLDNLLSVLCQSATVLYDAGITLTQQPTPNTKTVEQKTQQTQTSEPPTVETVNKNISSQLEQTTPSTEQEQLKTEVTAEYEVAEPANLEFKTEAFIPIEAFKPEQQGEPERLEIVETPTQVETLESFAEQEKPRQPSITWLEQEPEVVVLPAYSLNEPAVVRSFPFRMLNSNGFDIQNTSTVLIIPEMPQNIYIEPYYENDTFKHFVLKISNKNMSSKEIIFKIMHSESSEPLFEGKINVIELPQRFLMMLTKLEQAGVYKAEVKAFLKSDKEVPLSAILKINNNNIPFNTAEPFEITLTDLPSNQEISIEVPQLKEQVPELPESFTPEIQIISLPEQIKITNLEKLLDLTPGTFKLSVDRTGTFVAFNVESDDTKNIVILNLETGERIEVLS